MGTTTFSGPVRGGGAFKTSRGTMVQTIESKPVLTDVVAGDAVADTLVVSNIKLPANSYVKSCVVIADPDNTATAGTVNVGVDGDEAILASGIAPTGAINGGVIADPAIGLSMGGDAVDITVTPAALTDGNTIVRLEYWVYDSKNGEA